MCDNCGCGHQAEIRIIVPEKPTHDHVHEDEHDHDHHHAHKHPQINKRRELVVEQDILAKNRLYAERNRGYFEAKNITALNFVSSPGSGKTTLVEEIIRRIAKDVNIYVVEGDQQGSLDSDRIAKLEVPVIQINTGSSCHLEAETVGNAVKKLNPKDRALLIIENVGNLMCPSLFDLGEHYRVVLLSTVEGDDKPLKYPNMFDTSHLCIISKSDLLPYSGFDIEKARKNALLVNPNLKIIQLSAATGEGMDLLVQWLEDIRQ